MPTPAQRRRRHLLLLGGATLIPFAPTDLPGLLYWFKADAGTFQDAARTTPATANDDPVGGWADQSGAAEHASQATDGRRPLLRTGANGLNGLPVLQFDGTADFLATPALTQAQPMTMYLVFRQLTWTSGDRIVGTSNQTEVLQRDLTPQVAIYAGGASVVPITPAGTPALNTAIILTGIYDGNANSVLEINNEGDVAGVNTGTAGLVAQAVHFGSNSGGISAFGNIELAETALYAGRHSADSRASMKDYLNGRWGVY